MDIDSLFFSSVLKKGKPAFMKGVRAEFFEDEWREVFSFVRTFLSEHGRLPKLTTVKGKFKDVPFYKALEPTPFYAKELRTRYAFGLLDEGMRTKYTPKRSDHNLGGSIDALKGVILTIQRLSQKQAMGAGLLRANKGTLKRKKAYLKRKKMKGILGIRSMWPSLDSVTLGWQLADLIVVLARSGIGKTFFALLNVIAAQKLGKNGLFASMEMYPEKMSIRYDALGAGVSVEGFRKGKLVKSDVKKIDKWYKQLEQSKKWGHVDFCGANEVSSPLDLELLIQLGNYDFVVWDSFYRAAKKKKWEEFAQLISDVKTVATRTGVPIMVTSQFNKDVKTAHTKADQTAAAFTDSILHDADFVFALFQTPSMKLMKEMLLRSLKIREGINLDELMLRWDIDGGDFSEQSNTLVSGMEEVGDLDAEVELSYEY